MGATQEMAELGFATKPKRGKQLVTKKRPVMRGDETISQLALERAHVGRYLIRRGFPEKVAQDVREAAGVLLSQRPDRVSAAKQYLSDKGYKEEEIVFLLKPFAKRMLSSSKNFLRAG